MQLVASIDFGNYHREVSNILDLLGTMGGILEVFFIILEAIMNPISEHAFTCAAIQAFYLVKHSAQEMVFG